MRAAMMLWNGCIKKPDKADACTTALKRAGQVATKNEKPEGTPSATGLLHRRTENGWCEIDQIGLFEWPLW
jgi:hypothetical protein